MILPLVRSEASPFLFTLHSFTYNNNGNTTVKYHIHVYYSYQVDMYGQAHTNLFCFHYAKVSFYVKNRLTLVLTHGNTGNTWK